MISPRADCVLRSMRPHVGGLIRFDARLTKIEKPGNSANRVYHLEGAVFLLLEVYSKIDSAGRTVFENRHISRYMSPGYLRTHDQNSIVSILMHEGVRIMAAFAPHEVVLLEHDGNEVQEISFPI